MGAQGGRFGGLWRDRRDALLLALAVIRRATTYSAGGAGRDTIKGGSGDDRLFADAGGALMVGGKGSDEFNMVNATEGGCEPDSAKIKAHA